MKTARDFFRGIATFVVCVMLFCSGAVGGDNALLEKGWPLIKEQPVGDGEDAETNPEARYFGFGNFGFQLQVETNPLKPGRQLTKAIELFGEEGHDPLVLKAPADTLWIVDEILALPDHSLLVWEAETSGVPGYQTAHTSPWSLGPVLKKRTATEPGALVAQGRLTIDGPVPEELRNVLKESNWIPAGEAFWGEVGWPIHTASFTNARESVTALLENSFTNEEAGETIGLLKRLFAQPTIVINRDKLPGSWRVRSIQVSGDFAFAYPYFKATITSKPEGLFFRKTTGSQRCSGFLYVNNPKSLVFLGGVSVNDDPLTVYSRLAKTSESAPAESDTWGILEALSDDHLILMRDFGMGDSVEIYELHRSTE